MWAQIFPFISWDFLNGRFVYISQPLNLNKRQTVAVNSGMFFPTVYAFKHSANALYLFKIRLEYFEVWFDPTNKTIVNNTYQEACLFLCLGMVNIIKI